MCVCARVCVCVYASVCVCECMYECVCVRATRKRKRENEMCVVLLCVMCGMLSTCVFVVLSVRVAANTQHVVLDLRKCVSQCQQ